MGDIPAGNMCHEYYLRVSENSPLIRKNSYPEDVAVHTVFVKGQSGAQTPPTNMWGQHWVAQVISTYLFSVQWMVTPSGTPHPTQAWVPEPPWSCSCLDATHRHKKSCHLVHKTATWMDHGNLPCLQLAGSCGFCPLVSKASQRQTENFHSTWFFLLGL